MVAVSFSGLMVAVSGGVLWPAPAGHISRPAPAQGAGEAPQCGGGLLFDCGTSVFRCKIIPFDYQYFTFWHWQCLIDTNQGVNVNRLISRRFSEGTTSRLTFSAKNITTR
jgi:hypothetical protein